MPDFKYDDFVSRIVSDPNNPPDALLLTGYLGKSSDQGYIRLYLDEELSDYVELPESGVLYAQEMSKEDSPLGGSYVWIQRNAQVIQGPVGPNRMTASFLSGRIQRQQLVAAQPPAAPPGPALPITVGGPACRTDIGPCPTDVGPRCTQFGPRCRTDFLPCPTEGGPQCPPTAPDPRCPPPTAPDPRCPPPTAPDPRCPPPTAPDPRCPPPTAPDPRCPPPTAPDPRCPPQTAPDPRCPTATGPRCTQFGPRCRTDFLPCPTEIGPRCQTRFDPACPFPTELGPRCTTLGPRCF
jgi:hypothetical protein